VANIGAAGGVIAVLLPSTARLRLATAEVNDRLNDKKKHLRNHRAAGASAQPPPRPTSTNEANAEQGYTGFFTFTGMQVLPPATLAANLAAVDRHADHHGAGDHENGHGAARHAEQCGHAERADDVDTVQLFSRSQNCLLLLLRVQYQNNQRPAPLAWVFIASIVCEASVMLSSSGSLKATRVGPR